MFNDELLSRIRENPVIAVLVVDDADDAAPLAAALLEGGVTAMELTLRTPAALDALAAIRRLVPEMIAGIGTVLTREQVRAAHGHGAAFAVSPGLNPNVLDEARRLGMPFAPGVVTPTDIERALELDCRLMKFFPAEPSGGLAYLRSMAAPYAHLGVQFIPLGGLNITNMATYLADPLIAAIGGSWLAPRSLVQAHDWDGIRRRAAAAVRATRDEATPENEGAQA